MQGNNRNTQGAEIKCIFYVSFYALPRKIHLWCCHSKTSSARLMGSSTSACSNMKKSFTHQKNNLQKSNKSTVSFNQKKIKIIELLSAFHFKKDIMFKWCVLCICIDWKVIERRHLDSLMECDTVTLWLAPILAALLNQTRHPDPILFPLCGLCC